MYFQEPIYEIHEENKGATFRDSPTADDCERRKREKERERKLQAIIGEAARLRIKDATVSNKEAAV